MKKNIYGWLITLFCLVSSLALLSQNSVPALQGLHDQYILIKNALVSGNPAEAAKQAAIFADMAVAKDVKKLTETEQKALNGSKPLLVAEARSIAGSKDITKQRDVFISFSDGFIQLAKSAQVSKDKIYIDYCPMKKAYWLSEGAQVKNPFYGNQMLTCGKLTETLYQ